MRAKSFEFSGLTWASAGDVQERLTPARSDRDHRAAAHTCILSGAAPMPLRMSALVHSSSGTKSSRSRSLGGFQHLLNNFLSGRTDPSCTLERLRGCSCEERPYRTSLVVSQYGTLAHRLGARAVPQLSIPAESRAHGLIGYGIVRCTPTCAADCCSGRARLRSRWCCRL